MAHADPYKAGHGPGVTGLLSALSGELLPVVDPDVDIPHILGIGSQRATITWTGVNAQTLSDEPPSPPARI